MRPPGDSVLRVLRHWKILKSLKKPTVPLFGSNKTAQKYLKDVRHIFCMINEKEEQLELIFFCDGDKHIISFPKNGMSAEYVKPFISRLKKIADVFGIDQAARTMILEQVEKKHRRKNENAKDWAEYRTNRKKTFEIMRGHYGLCPIQPLMMQYGLTGKQIEYICKMGRDTLGITPQELGLTSLPTKCFKLSNPIWEAFRQDLLKEEVI